MPSKTLAATIQPQLGAVAISTGTGSATAQPATSSRRRPARWASAPAPRLVSALTNPKATMNDSTAALEARWKLSRPIRGSVGRSSPTIAPTNAVTATSSANRALFSRSPSRTVRAAVIGRLALAALLDVDEQRGPDDVGGDPREHDALGDRVHRQRTSVTAWPARLAATISACCAGAGGTSWSSASTNASSESNCNAALCRRSNPIVEEGLADNPRPHSDPE